MGNNVKLKYIEIDASTYNLKQANTHLENARKALRESTDLGSSIMQAFWKFGNKEAIFGALKSVQNNINYEKEENINLINALNNVESIYEQKVKSVSNNFLFDLMLFSSAAVVAPYLIPAIVPLVGLVLFGGKTTCTFKKKNVPSDIIKKGSALSVAVGGSLISGPVVTTINSAAITSSNSVQAISDIVNDLDIKAGMCLDNIWQSWGPVSKNGFTNYNGKGNCTWYADNRYNQMNPNNPLVFSTTSGRNAKNWINTIDKSKFNVLPSSGTSNVTTNSIAVSQNGTYGHVAYIEQVKDGKVYFTEDGESYTRPHTWNKDSNGNWTGPTVQCMDVNIFKSKFQNVISAK